jgi:hypothetical protein
MANYEPATSEDSDQFFIRAAMAMANGDSGSSSALQTPNQSSVAQIRSQSPTQTTTPNPPQNIDDNSHTGEDSDQFYIRTAMSLANNKTIEPITPQTPSSKIGWAWSGAKSSVFQAAGGTALVAGGAATAVEKGEDLSQSNTSDYIFGHIAKPLFEHEAANPPPPKDAPLSVKAAYSAGQIVANLALIFTPMGVGAMAGKVAGMVAAKEAGAVGAVAGEAAGAAAPTVAGEAASAIPEATGEATAPTVASEAVPSVAPVTKKSLIQNIEEHGTAAATTMLIPAVSDGLDTARKVYEETGSGRQALEAGLTQYLATTSIGLVPLSMSGGLLTRAATGAVSGAATSELVRPILNSVLPADMQQPFDVDNVMMNAMFGATLGGVLGPRKVDPFKPIQYALEEVARQSEAAQKANEAAAALRAASENLGKIGASSPEEFDQKLGQLNEQPLFQQSVFVPAAPLRDALLQNPGATEAVHTAIPGIEQKISEALHTGTDVEISAQDYLKHISPALGKDAEPLLHQARVGDADAMNEQEAKAYEDSLSDMKATAEKVTKEQSEKNAQDIAVENARKSMEDQLNATGLFTKAVAKQYSHLYAAYVDTRAKDLGISPEAFHQQYGPSVVKGTTENDSLLGSYDRGTKQITLFQNADLSTFTHELAHHFLENEIGLARKESADGTPTRISEGVSKLLGSNGITGNLSEQLAHWDSLTSGERVSIHEKTAKEFEKYLMTGLAPGVEHQSLFRSLRDFMKAVYSRLLGQQNGRVLPGSLSDEVKWFFDRMLASNEAIEDTEKARNYFPIFRTPEDAAKAGIPSEQYQAYLRLQKEAATHSEELLAAKATAGVDGHAAGKLSQEWSAEKQREHEKLLADTEKQATKEVMGKPIYKLWDFLTGTGKEPEDGEPVTHGKLLYSDVVNLVGEKVAENLKNRGMTTDDPAKGISAQDLAGRFRDILGDQSITDALNKYAEPPHPLEPKEPVLRIYPQSFSPEERLVRALDSVEPPEVVIKALTDERMREHESQIRNQAELAAEAMVAAHNDARGRFLASGAKLLAKSAVPVQKLIQAAKEIADRIISSSLIKDVNPNKYLAAEARANKNAIRELDKGEKSNKAVAAGFLRTALLNFHLYNAATKAEKEVGNAVRYLQRLEDPKSRSRISADALDQIDAILERFSIRTSTNQEKMDKKLAETLQDYSERMTYAGYDAAAIEQWILEQRAPTHYTNLSVEEMRGLKASIENIVRMGKKEKYIVVDGKEVALSAAVEEAQKVAEYLGTKTTDTNRGKPDTLATSLNNAKVWFNGLFGALTKADQMIQWLDGGDGNGPFTKYLLNGLRDAQGYKARLKEEINERIRKAINEVPQSVFDKQNRLYTIPGAKDGVTGEDQVLNWKEKIALAAIKGDAEHFDKLLRGEGWDASAINDFLDHNVSKDEWEFIEKLAATFQHLFPLKQAMLERVGAEKMVEVRKLPFSTYDPETNTRTPRAGWYWPITYDPTRSHTIAEMKERDLYNTPLYGGGVGTQTGRENQRKQKFAKPMLLTLDALQTTLEAEIHDISYRPALMDAWKFLNQHGTRESVVSILSNEHFQELRNWIRSIANDSTPALSDIKQYNDIFRLMRSRATIMALGYNVGVMVLHGSTAFWESATELGPKYFTKGLMNEKTLAALTSIGPKFIQRGFEAMMGKGEEWAAKRDWIFSQSDVMKYRANEIERDIKARMEELNLRLSSTGMSKIKRAMIALEVHAYDGIAMLDMASALPVWMGAYMRAKASWESGGLGLDDKEAIRRADQAVLNAHGGSGDIDLARIQRSNETMKAFTGFYTFWNHNVNREMDLVYNISRYSRLKKYREANNIRVYGVSPGALAAKAAMYTLGVQIIHGYYQSWFNKEDRKDEGWMHWFAREIGGAATGGLPIIRDLYEGAVNGTEASFTSFGIVYNDLSSFYNDLTDDQKHNKAWIKDAMNAIGATLGVPLAQIGKSAQFITDYEQHKYQTLTAEEFASGLVHGRVVNKRIGE